MTNFETEFKAKARRAHEESMDRTVAGISEVFGTDPEVTWECLDAIINLGIDPLNQNKYLHRSEELARETNDPMEFLSAMVGVLQHYASISIEFMDVNINDEIDKLENLANKED